MFCLVLSWQLLAEDFNFFYYESCGNYIACWSSFEYPHCKKVKSDEIVWTKIAWKVKFIHKYRFNTLLNYQHIRTDNWVQNMTKTCTFHSTERWTQTFVWPFRSCVGNGASFNFKVIDKLTPPYKGSCWDWLFDRAWCSKVERGSSYDSWNIVKDPYKRL